MILKLYSKRNNESHSYATRKSPRVDVAVFFDAGRQNSNDINFQFWLQDNRFVEIRNKDFAFQKFDYIHNNAVGAGMVGKAEEHI